MNYRIKKALKRWANGVCYIVYLAYCKCRFGRDVCLIPLRKGNFAIVDKKNYEWLSKLSWRARRFDNAWYAIRWVRKSEKRNKTIEWMHRAVMKAPEGLLIDHENHNGLDNREANLRPATYSQNMQNRRKIRIPCSSKYKGVMYRKGKHRRKKWRASIKAQGRFIELGMFATEVEAARAYDTAAMKYFEKFAYLNFPRTDYTGGKYSLRKIIGRMVKVIADCRLPIANLKREDGGRSKE
jgi:hypothetical protein